MKNRFFTLLSLSVLMLVVLMGVVSAVALNEITEHSIPLEVSQDDGSFTFTFELTNTGVAGSLDFELSDVTNEGADIEFDTFAIADGSTDDFTKTITATVTFPFDSISPISGTVDVVGESASTHETLDFSVTMTPSIKPEDVQTCAVTGNDAGSDNDDLQLSIEDVIVKGFGDEYDWLPFDEVEVEIQIENDNDDYKMKEIVIEWGLYNTETEDWYVDDEENDFKLSDGDDKTLYLTFSLDDDIDDLAEGNYVFYVWANAELDDDSGDIPLCASEYETVEIQIEDDFVILGNIKYLETVACGTEVELTADVVNIGDDEQEDVYVIIYNNELKINQRIDIGDIDEFEDEKLNVLLSIPEDAEEKGYDLSLMVFDEYDDRFENDFDEEESRFIKRIVVEGSCVHEPKIEISADLESEAKTGKELIIRTTIKNTGIETSTFEISLDDYINWASLENIVPESITLNAGESEDVLITLDVNSDVSGNQNFQVVVTEGTNVLSKQISVTIKQREFGGLSKITGGLISESNWPIWTIGAVNIILVFVIILVALKVAKK
jgi:hypothetical protein